MPITPDDVLDFWFLPPGDPDHGKYRDVWFEATDAFNDELRRRFADAVEPARTGALDHWTATADGSLALVLLLDQVPRNLHPGKAESFACDPRARQVADGALAQGFDRQVLPAGRWFFYLPFEHSEALSDQERAVALFESLGDDPEREVAVRAARDHRDVIARFGRFPHRNKALGRATTTAEEEFMATAPPPFGRGEPVY